VGWRGEGCSAGGVRPSPTEACGDGWQRRQPAGLGTVPGSRARSKWKSGALGESDGAWKSLTRWGSPWELWQPCAPTTGSRGGGDAEAHLWQPPHVLGEHHATAAPCLSSQVVLPRDTAKGGAGLLSPTPILGHISRKGLSEPASSRDASRGTAPSPTSAPSVLETLQNSWD